MLPLVPLRPPPSGSDHSVSPHPARKLTRNRRPGNGAVSSFAVFSCLVTDRCQSLIPTATCGRSGGTRTTDEGRLALGRLLDAAAVTVPHSNTRVSIRFVRSISDGNSP